MRIFPGPVIRRAHHQVRANDLDAGIISTAALADGSVTTAKFASGAVDQTAIGSAAVGQGELITTNGQVSTTGSTLLDLTLPGGAYGFYPQTWVSNGAKTTAANIASVVSSTSAVTNIALAISVASGGDTARAQQTYVTASPPYDLGDGPVDGSFIFLIIDGLGNVVATYQAPDPPWAYNGPTDIRPDAVIDGVKYKRVGNLSAAALRTDDALAADLIAGRLNLETQLVEITQAVKNADMPLLPHPFTGNDLTGKTVVLLDPMHPAMRTLHDLQQAGEDVADLLYNRIKPGNTAIPNRGAPPGVMTVSFHL